MGPEENRTPRTVALLSQLRIAPALTPPYSCPPTTHNYCCYSSDKAIKPTCYTTLLRIMSRLANTCKLNYSKMLFSVMFNIAQKLLADS